MAKESPIKVRKKKGFRNLIFLFIILFLIIGIPYILIGYQAKQKGMTRSEVIKRIVNRTGAKDEVAGTEKNNRVGAKIDLLDPIPVGQKFTEAPLISNVQAVDLDGDGLMDIIVCDCKSNSVNWIRQFPAGVYTETVLADGLNAPAHVQVIDFDKDGHNDILVAVLGLLFPSNDKIGSVVILQNDGTNHFIKHVVIDKIARVSDVRAGDLDGDGDMDLAVAQFGYDDGETRWMENLGNWKFKSHILQNLSGPINVILDDIDKDGDLDIISLVSQEWEEIYCFINDGKGNFTPKLLYGSSNEDFGSSSIFICDLNKDGKDDILYTNGDAFDYIPPQGRPWHGVQWLENKGNMNFEYHRICNFIGAYNARPVDIDNDGDLDIFCVSAFNLWDKPESQSFIWLENDGKMNFTLHNIASSPTHILTLESGDFNNDGLMDFVTGDMHAYPPYDRMGRITLWLNNGKLAARKN
jgi:FG-GAP-like repeat